ncbi:MAG: hypothetical protein COA94_03445, partial [Rickettsiales bacterium]
RETAGVSEVSLRPLERSARSREKPREMQLKHLHAQHFNETVLCSSRRRRELQLARNNQRDIKMVVLVPARPHGEVREKPKRHKNNTAFYEKYKNILTVMNVIKP